MEQLKLTFKHNSGDGQLTDDWYLWINKKPTKHCVSQCGAIFYAYIDGEEKAMFDSLKEAKEFILEKLGYDR